VATSPLILDLFVLHPHWRKCAGRRAPTCLFRFAKQRVHERVDIGVWVRHRDHRCFAPPGGHLRRSYRHARTRQCTQRAEDRHAEVNSAPGVARFGLIDVWRTGARKAVAEHLTAPNARAAI